MSIRLRFTLLYTLILALTLTVFGASLYTIQAQETLRALKLDLNQGAAKLAEAALKAGSHPLPSESSPPPSPIPFGQFSSDPAFQAFPEPEIGRILDANGNLVASPLGRQGDALPLSAAGLQALKDKQDWWETEVVSGDKMLIYSRPVIVNDKVVYIVQVARALTERERTLQSLATTLLIAGLLTALIAFGVGWMLSEITFRPIQRMTQTAQAIGEKRDFTRRVTYRGPPDEVGQLAGTFNSMLSRLQAAFQEVERSLQRQRDFVADVSHELRTPLTTLRGNLGLLRRQPPVPPAEQADILNDMVHESDRLIRLVNDLLLLARADTGRNLAREPVDVSTILDETFRQARQLDAQRPMELDVPPGLKVLGDRDAVKQLLLIALDNALKHSTGKIHVSAQRKNASVEIRVQDSGEGIRPEKLQHVFDRFYRGDEAGTTAGSGLGLPIAKSLAERQGGAVDLESELGKGTVLIFRFPSVV